MRRASPPQRGDGPGAGVAATHRAKHSVSRRELPDSTSSQVAIA